MNDSQLADEIIQSGITMVTKERFDMILNHKDNIKNLSGDVVECGVWAGGMSIFLSKIFSNKKIWVCDSYEGCQDPKEGLYFYPNETHSKGQYAYSLDQVKNNFINSGSYDENRVYFLKGYVKDTLNPNVCSIKNISLLRIDVDSYSATLEVLDALYDKVVDGGYIIFDDTCLHETHDAIKTFLHKRNIKNNFILDPFDNKINIVETPKLPCGCYIVK